jgi:hypothetical protein
MVVLQPRAKSTAIMFQQRPCLLLLWHHTPPDRVHWTIGAYVISAPETPITVTPPTKLNDALPSQRRTVDRSPANNVQQVLICSKYWPDKNSRALTIFLNGRLRC